MTVLIGVLCQDGVVIGADGAATFGVGNFRTVEQKTAKIEIIADKVIVAGTGEIGLGQRFVNIVEQGWHNNIFSNQPVHACAGVCQATVGNFQQTGLHLPNIGYGALVAFPHGETPNLCEFAVGNFQPELKTDRLWYVSMGSGQAIADPFLALMRSVFWKDQPPTRQDGIFAVTWALLHAIDCNPGGIGEPLQIAVLARESGQLKARLLTEEELKEHRENVEGVSAYLSDYTKQLSGQAEGVPSPPQAPSA